MVVHRDPRLMPSSKHSWSPLNILVAPVNDTQEPTRPDSEASNAGEPTAETKVEALTSEHSKQFNNSNNINHKSRNAAWSPSTADLSQQMPMCTVWMQCIDTRVDPDVLQTWNPLVEPDVAATGPVMADASFERPVVTVASAQVMPLRALRTFGSLHVINAFGVTFVFVCNTSKDRTPSLCVYGKHVLLVHVLMAL